MGYWRQLKALLWKNYLLKKRLYFSTFFELVLPALVMLIMVWAKTATSKTLYDINYQLDQGKPLNVSDRLAGMLQNMGADRMLAFTPNNSVTQNIASWVTDTYCPGLEGRIVFFETEADLESYVVDPAYGNFGDHPSLKAAVVLSEWSPSNFSFSYSIRMNSSGGFDEMAVPDTRTPETFNLAQGYISTYFKMYYDDGFLGLQNMMDNYIFQNYSLGPANIYLQPFPTPSYTSDPFAQIIAGVLGLFFTLVYIWPVTRLVKNIVEEKELRIKEGMKMMGLLDSALWQSWFITYVVIFGVTSILITLFTSSTLYEYSNKFLIFLFFEMFGVSVFCFCYMISSVFTRARLASTMAALVFLGMFFGYFAISGLGVTKMQKISGSLACNIAFGQGAVVLVNLESSQIGIQWDNMSTEFENYSYSICMWMLLLDSVFYLCVGLYLDNVLPSTYGVHQPWYFVCNPRYWCPGRSSGPTSSVKGYSNLPTEEKEELLVEDTETVEAVGSELRGQEKIKLLNLRKVYSGDEGEVVAVKGLSINMYQGQIFALLGHNGAGKTTTISMLTGLYGPTSGDARIFGQSILEDMQLIREGLGVCPQHDILFPLLTVSEHLELFATIKGLDRAKIPDAVDAMIHQVGLEEKRHAKAGGLSGGQMRKLSVGIALIGDSKVVFLDEPTSGMDPYSRRATWDLLRKARNDRVIILTTHFMDEADQLGDRIAIMAKGELRCCGSSLFLKSHYGVGYTVTLVKRPDCNKQAIFKLCQQYVEKCSVLSDAANELAFRFPFESSSKFPGFFQELDARAKELGVDSYGISVTTLEEVFLRVGRDEFDPTQRDHEEEEKLKRKVSENNMNAESKSVEDSVLSINGQDADAQESLPDFIVALRHFWALFVKRLQWAKRDRKVMMWQVVYPFLIMLGGLAALAFGNQFYFPSIAMDTHAYNVPLHIPYNGNNPLADFYMAQLDNPDKNIPDAAYNVSDEFTMQEYLLATMSDYAQTKYGAFLFYNNLTAPTAPNYTAFFNTTAIYSVLVYINMANNLILKQWTNNSAANIKTYNHPLPATAGIQVLNTSSTAFIISIAFAFIPATFAAFVVRERASKSKHIQLISGVSTVAYWLSTWVWDIINYLLPACLTIILLYAYDVGALIGENLGATVVVMLLFATSVCPFLYCLSFLFENPSSVQNMSLIISFLGGVVLTIVRVVLLIISDSTRDAEKILRPIFRLLPAYCFGEALGNICVRTSPVATFGDPKGVWDPDIAGDDCIYMACETVIYFILVLVIEWVLRTPALLSYFRLEPNVTDQPVEEDIDVQNERKRIQEGGAKDDIIRLEGLRKVFASRMGQPAKVAVRDLWFGVPLGQCFGFLGINGAGKTTALKMLTGDVIPTGGTAELGGFDILRQQQQVRRLLGYCPQFDALLPNLTGREHLSLFARIKCVPNHRVSSFVNAMIKQLGLEEYADKPAGTYSGGNKRKLSVGIALIGNPQIVFLDEPSTGMDPKSRRFMWDLIASTMADRAVVLTTHSMEECEALCGRIAILVGGRLRCLGSAQHLKSRYGDGYQLSLKIAEVKSSIEEHKELEVVRESFENGNGLPMSERDSKGKERFENLCRFVEGTFKDSALIETNGSLILKYRVPKDRLSLSVLFSVIEENRNKFFIEAYSVSDTTLEQIFIHFARQQEEETGTIEGLVPRSATGLENVVKS